METTIEEKPYKSFFIKDKEVLVDAEDYDRVMEGLTWGLDKGNYVKRGFKTERVRTTQKLHRLIMNCDFGDKRVIDHINGNPLDNRKENLRFCTQADNTKNRSKSKNNTSGYKGVHWNKINKKWQAYIMYNYKQIHLGYFIDKEEASQAYEEASEKYFGEFKRIEP